MYLQIKYLELCENIGDVECKLLATCISNVETLCVSFSRDENSFSANGIKTLSQAIQKLANPVSRLQIVFENYSVFEVAL